VRGSLVALGGEYDGYDWRKGCTGRVDKKEVFTSSVEVLPPGEQKAFVDLPPLSCGSLAGTQAVAMEESNSTAGTVLLLGGGHKNGDVVSTVYLVDLATGVCTPQSSLLIARHWFAAARLPDGRIACAGGCHEMHRVMRSAEVMAVDGTWTKLPSMLAARAGCRGCVLSDGRFAVLGGRDNSEPKLASCEVIAVGDVDATWKPMPPMYEARDWFACAAVAGCIIVAGGHEISSAELFDEGLNRWFRLPVALPTHYGLIHMGCVLL
jgi:hypothetical protein